MNVKRVHWPPRLAVMKSGFELLRPQQMSRLQCCLVKGRPTKKLIKFAQEKVIKNKWRAEISKEDQRRPKLVWGLAARYLHFTFIACEWRIIESFGDGVTADGTQTSSRLQKQLACAAWSFFEEKCGKNKRERSIGDGAQVQRFEAATFWRAQRQNGLSKKVKGEEIIIFLFCAGSWPSSPPPPLPLTHQVFRSPCLLNRHLRLNISPVGSVSSGGGEKNWRIFWQIKHWHQRAQWKNNLVLIERANGQSNVYCYRFY